ncbi:MAG: dihydroorotate dehydrogenase electron transfer subunit [bacterium]|nr:dihydroorotate dehydrogenase electron transfer subunit [bacterium]
MRASLTANYRRGRVISCQPDGDLYFDLELSVEQETPAQPGQFYLVAAEESLDESLDPLLKRPLSILTSTNDRLGFLFKVVGRGTRALARLDEGDGLDLLGPLGNPFTIDAEPQPLLVGGGVGVPPLIFLSQQLSAAGIAHRVVFAFGTAGDIPKWLLQGMENKVEICTLDGTCGFHGNPVDYLAAEQDRAPARIQACGPGGMLAALRGLRKPGDEIELSLEEHMACGVGICRGCAVPVKDGDDWRYATICREGPVFPDDVLHHGELEAPLTGPGSACRCGEENNE